jgi:hypothetical protein
MTRERSAEPDPNDRVKASTSGSLSEISSVWA